MLCRSAASQRSSQRSRLKKRKKGENSGYCQMMEELMNAYVGMDIMDQVLDPKKLEKTSLPQRYRLIALGFLKHETLDELNDNLINNGCQPLYSRSSFEATLIYAFANQLSYSEWKRLAAACEKVRAQCKGPKAEQEDNAFFQGKYITFGELEEYVQFFSQSDGKTLVTRQLTQQLDQSIRMLGSDYVEFFQFYASNLLRFSDVREKTRYYFCKYLYYYLLEKIKRYQMEVGGEVPTQEELLELLPLKAESRLRRKRTEPESLMDILRSCAISPAAIFEEFNYYYFEYVSLDWVELMLENVQDVDELDERHLSMVASYLRENISKKERERVAGFDDRALVQDRIRRAQDADGDIATSRRGENAIRKYLRGELDIDRTTLICFLLFWGSEETNRNEIRISEERINTILDECGFSMLRKKNPFDHFVLQYMKSSDPVTYLMEEMDRYLERGETFFVYEVYANSDSNAKKIRQQMLN